MLPKIKHPRILDIGCGTGIPTVELAKMSGGEVIGIDIDDQALHRCNDRIKQAHLADRAKTIRCSLVDMDFTDEYFDIIWAEGTVFILGFQQSLTKWRRFIKPGGFLVLHDEVGDLSNKLKMIPGLGFALIDNILISGDDWWEKYFKPLQEGMRKIYAQYRDNKEARDFLDARQAEIDKFNKDREANGSVYIILQRSPLR